MSRAPSSGIGERCGNANLSTIIPNLQLKRGYACIPERAMARLTATARAGGRDLQHRPRPAPALCRQERLRPQGRHAHRRRASRTRAPSSICRPRTVGNAAALPDVRGLRPEHDPAASSSEICPELDEGLAGDRGRSSTSSRSWNTRLPVRGADSSFELLVRQAARASTSPSSSSSISRSSASSRCRATASAAMALIKVSVDGASAR